MAATGIGGEDGSLKDAEMLTSGAAAVSSVSSNFDGWRLFRTRLFATDEFFKLWLAQMTTSVGEWVFFLVVTVKAAQVGAGTPEGAVALVLLARLGPSFFLSPLAGVLADRWNRQKMMVLCDLARAVVVSMFAFFEHVWQLILASLAIEGFAMLWIPAKEALVPSLLPRKHLPTANTLSAIATYGTFPVALLVVFALDSFRGDDTALGFWFDAATFLMSALLIASIAVPSVRSSGPKSVDQDMMNLRGVWRDIKHGWGVVFDDPRLKAVNVGLAVALLGGGMLVPLGTVYATEVLSLPSRGYYTMLMGLGAGVIVGALALLGISEAVNRPKAFGMAVIVAGLSLLIATSLTVLWMVVVMLGIVGAAVGVTYVLGFTILQEATDDELRGRVFAAFYTLSRAGIVTAIVGAPALAVFFDRVSELTSDGAVGIGDYRLLIPGVRITFWVASLIILVAGVFAMKTLRRDTRPGLQVIE